MQRAFLLFLLAAFATHVADAREVRRDAVPEAFWGTWALAENPCKDEDTSAIRLSATAYAGPAGNCDIKYVTEIPGRGGAIYSARMQCPAAGAQGKTTTFVNLIIRSDDGGKISVGPTFERLVSHRRCSTAGPAAKQK